MLSQLSFSPEPESYVLPEEEGSGGGRGAGRGPYPPSDDEEEGEWKDGGSGSGDGDDVGPRILEGKTNWTLDYCRFYCNLKNKQDCFRLPTLDSTVIKNN